MDMIKLKKDGANAWIVAKDPSIKVFKCVKRFKSGEWYVTQNDEELLYSHYKHAILEELEILKPELAA
jgi:hypothetical protein